MEMNINTNFLSIENEQLELVNGGDGKWPWELFYDFSKDMGALFYHYFYKGCCW